MFLDTIRVCFSLCIVENNDLKGGCSTSALVSRYTFTALFTLELGLRFAVGGQMG